MISECLCHPDAARSLGHMADLRAGTDAVRVEVEFKEIPYFIVKRARLRTPEMMTSSVDLNRIHLVGVTDAGLVFVDDLSPAAGTRVFVPWTNVLSISISPEPRGNA
jgi:hypothetical protein